MTQFNVTGVNAEGSRLIETYFSCLLMNTAAEFAQKDSLVARSVADGLEGLRAILQVAVQRGQLEGEITLKLDPELLAGYFVCSIGGIKTVVKGGMDDQKVKEIVEITLKTLN